MAHSIRIDRSRLHPLLDMKLTKLLHKCEKKKIYLIITEGYRTKEYQDSLYAQGRTKPGKIVTNARGSTYSSQHMWGIAFDIAIHYQVDASGKKSEDLYNIKVIKRVAKIAKSLGLGWGGDWKTFQDTPHFYLKTWGSTTTELKAIYKTPEKFRESWYQKVDRKKGLLLYKDLSRIKSYLRIPNGKNVLVIYKKLWYARVKYADKIGYVNRKYIK